LKVSYGEELSTVNEIRPYLILASNITVLDENGFHVPYVDKYLSYSMKN